LAARWALIIDFSEVILRVPAAEIPHRHFGLNVALVVGGVSWLAGGLYPQLEAWFERRSRSSVWAIVTALAGETSWKRARTPWWAAGWPPDRPPLIKKKAADPMPKPDPPRPAGSWTAGSRGCFHGGGDSRVRPPQPIRLKSRRRAAGSEPVWGPISENDSYRETPLDASDKLIYG
jgi:hypothetical protein